MIHPITFMIMILALVSITANLTHYGQTIVKSEEVCDAKFIEGKLETSDCIQQTTYSPKYNIYGAGGMISAMILWIIIILYREDEE